MGIFGKKGPETIRLTGPGQFRTAIKGESNYQKTLEAICGGKTRDGVDLKIEASLILEDANKYDKLAVYVDIKGKKVGYLSRDHAPQYRQQLKKDGHPHAIATCTARIKGGWDRGDDDQGDFGVWLDLPREYS